MKDWRGTEIVEGQTVIYGAPVGRSIALVEGVVDGFTPSGRVWILVKHRAYGYYSSDSKNRVHVGPDRLTIVDALPPTDLPTQSEKVAEAQERLRNRRRERIAALDAGEPERYEGEKAYVERFRGEV